MSLLVGGSPQLRDGVSADGKGVNDAMEYVDPPGGCPLCPSVGGGTGLRPSGLDDAMEDVDPPGGCSL